MLIVHEAWTTGGFGAEVASVIADKGFDWLDAPVKRLGAMDTPMPYNDELERATIPSRKDHRGNPGIDALKKLDAAVCATENLEETAKLCLLLHANNPRCFTLGQIEELGNVFGKAGG